MSLSFEKLCKLLKSLGIIIKTIYYENGGFCSFLEVQFEFYNFIILIPKLAFSLNFKNQYEIKPINHFSNSLCFSLKKLLKSFKYKASFKYLDVIIYDSKTTFQILNYKYDQNIYFQPLMKLNKYFNNTQELLIDLDTIYQNIFSNLKQSIQRIITNDDLIPKKLKQALTEKKTEYINLKNEIKTVTSKVIYLEKNVKNEDVNKTLDNITNLSQVKNQENILKTRQYNLQNDILDLQTKIETVYFRVEIFLNEYTEIKHDLKSWNVIIKSSLSF